MEEFGRPPSLTSCLVFSLFFSINNDLTALVMKMQMTFFKITSLHPLKTTVLENQSRQLFALDESFRKQWAMIGMDTAPRSCCCYFDAKYFRSCSLIPPRKALCYKLFDIYIATLDAVNNNYH